MCNNNIVEDAKLETELRERSVTFPMCETIPKMGKSQS
jgi:hypothetical protein